MNFTISEVFHIKSASEETFFKIMKNIEIFKPTNIHKVPGIFLKDGAEIVLKLINEICNLSISHGIFLNPCKIAKIKPIFKKDKKVDLSKDSSRYWHWFQKSLKRYFTTRQMDSSQAIKYYVTISLDSGLNSQLIWVYFS